MSDNRSQFEGSTQYLFDKFRTGRLKFSIGNKKHPEIVWRFKTRGYPPKGPESTPAFDKDSNLYFGCHDGCVYSLKSSGQLRWMFKTEYKVYSSPAITESENIIIAGGDGYLYNFSKDGEVVWIYDICQGYRKKTFKVISNRLCTILKTYDFDRKRVWNIKSWSSPNIGEHNVVYITGYGIGLHAVNLDTGQAEWVYNLGSPRFHLSGVALDGDKNIYACSQQTFLYSIGCNGDVKWKTGLAKGYDLWGNPTVDPKTNNVFVSASCREAKAIVYALTRDGQILWRKKIRGAIRGAASVSMEGYLVICSLNGCVYFFDKESGDIIYQKKFSNAQRGLWTTASIDVNGNILFTTKDSNTKGSLVCVNKEGVLLWRCNDIGKALSTPVLDKYGKAYIGSWNGELICLQT